MLQLGREDHMLPAPAIKPACYALNIVTAAKFVHCRSGQNLGKLAVDISTEALKSILQRFLDVTTAKKVAATLSCYCTEVPLQVECSARFPLSLLLH